MNDVNNIERARRGVLDNLGEDFEITGEVIFQNEGFGFNVEDATSILQDDLEQRIRGVLGDEFQNADINIKTSYA